MLTNKKCLQMNGVYKYIENCKIMLHGIYLLTLPLLCLCSRVLDEFNQKAVIVSDYCPTIPGCQDGTHVMCLHYNPNKPMGPACVHAVNISLTTEFSQLILDICNRIRSKMANGLGKGEDGVELPRGYGMLRLSWDPELATLAQVWAKQCILKSDYCRSTKRFPSAGQVIGMSRFTIRDWMPISLSNAHAFNSTTLTTDKIKYAIIYILKAWYEMKDEVTADTISYLDVTGYLKHNQFLQLVSGRSTHMGCGLNAYREYTYNDNNAALNFNSIQIVCNFSFRPRLGESVYTLEPPTEPGYTLKCGCPLGYDEDEDCLCYEADRAMPYTCKETGRCKPSLVVLPIFTVEDAPLNSIGQNNVSRITETRAVPGHKTMNSKPFVDYTRSYKDNVQIIEQDSVYKTRRISTDVKNRYFGPQANPKNINKLKTKPPLGENNRRKNHKQSIFAKAAVFELPSSKIKKVVHNGNYKKDVKPRRDFSKIQKLVSKYFEGRRMGHPLNKSNDNHNLTIIQSVKKDPLNNPNKVKNIVNNFNEVTKHKFTYMDLNSTRTPSPKHEIKSLNDENDQVFMNLLDKLEEEVENIDFNKKEKDIIDEKIRKIYGTLVKKSFVTEHSTINRNISMNKDILDDINVQNNVNLRNYWLDPNKPNEYTYPYLEEKPMNEKSIRNYLDKPDKVLQENKYIKNDKQVVYRSEPFYNQNIGERELRNMHSRKESHLKSMSKGNLRHNNFYLKSDLDDYNSLEPDRRYYYDKLNNLQRKISIMKKQGRQNGVNSQINNKINEDLHLRPVRPSKDENVRHRRPKEMDLYMPNRARFLHGF